MNDIKPLSDEEVSSLSLNAHLFSRMEARLFATIKARDEELGLANKKLESWVPLASWKNQREQLRLATERAEKAEKITATYGGIEDLLCPEFEGVDDLVECFRLLKEQRDQFAAQLNEALSANKRAKNNQSL